MRFAAFLRGINVGGHKVVKMADLQAAFEVMGFENVRTIQASGNVVFDARGGVGAETGLTVASATDQDAVLAGRIEDGLEEALGYPVGVAVRRLEDLERLVESRPFEGVPITPDTRLYVTFLLQPADNGTEVGPEEDSRRAKPAQPPELRVAQVTDGEVLTAISLSPRWGTTDLMDWLEEGYGPGITTRNWNTIAKLVGG